MAKTKKPAKQEELGQPHDGLVKYACATSTTFTHQRQLHLPIDLLASSSLFVMIPR